MNAPALLSNALHLLALFTIRAVLLIGAALLLSRTAWAKRRMIVPAMSSKQMRRELKSAIGTVLVDATIAALAIVSGVWSYSTSGDVLVTLKSIALMFVCFEVYYYAAHRALHHPALIFIHAQHHSGGKSTSALTSMSFSIAERLILQFGAIAISALLSRITAMSHTGVVIYFTANFVLNIWSHVGIEVTSASYRRSLLGRFFITTTFHALHHSKATRHFGLFTQVLDRWFGTEEVTVPLGGQAARATSATGSLAAKPSVSSASAAV